MCKNLFICNVFIISAEKYCIYILFNNNWNLFFSITIKDEIDYTPNQFLEIFGTKDIDGRKSYIDDDLSEERVCRRIPKVIYPQMAKNQANQWVYVVNEVEYTQAVVAEICE